MPIIATETERLQAYRNRQGWFFFIAAGGVDTSSVKYWSPAAVKENWESLARSSAAQRVANRGLAFYTDLL